MKLYFAPCTRAARTRWLLEELGVDYGLHLLDLQAEDHKQAEYLAINPLGQVPALIDGDVTLCESLATCLYLADKYRDRGLAPAHGSVDAARYFQWMSYRVATMEPAIFKFFGAWVWRRGRDRGRPSRNPPDPHRPR